MNELVRAAKTLTDPARVRVLNLLMQRECCVCEVMDVLDVSQVNASRYCTAISDAGFLKMRREGRWKHYRVDYNACSPVLRDMLDSVKATAVADSPKCVTPFRGTWPSALPQLPVAAHCYTAEPRTVGG